MYLMPVPEGTHHGPTLLVVAVQDVVVWLLAHDRATNRYPPVRPKLKQEWAPRENSLTIGLAAPVAESTVGGRQYRRTPAIGR